MKKNPSVISLILAVFFLQGLCIGADWPMWRYDANRSAASPEQLAPVLHLQWAHQYKPLTPAWEDPVNQDRMGFDKCYEPVVAGNTMFIGSNHSDKIVALDTKTGQEKWTFYAAGPIRFPAAVYKDKVYFVSDDGYLYCVSADAGELIWKFRGGPSDRKILGNGRLISTWPARGGPVIKDDIVYFSAGIWPFMGVFIHAIDAATGRLLWTNDGAGSEFISQPHKGAAAFGGIAPQGALAAIENRLIIPGGRSVPGCFDRRTGELIYYHLAGSKFHQINKTADTKREGGSHICGIGKYYFNHRGLNTSMYDIETGEMYFMWKMTTYPVLTEDTIYLSGKTVIAYDLQSLTKIPYWQESTSRRTKKKKIVTKYRWQMEKLWKLEVDARFALIKAGERLYAGGENIVSAIEISEQDKPFVNWTAKVNGNAVRLIAADDRLFVVTDTGQIYAFGAERKKSVMHESLANKTAPNRVMQLRAKEILKAANVDSGYCLIYGLDSGKLAEALIKNSNLRIIAVDDDEKKVAKLRKRFDAAGLYGSRISIHLGDAMTFEAPPYLADLTISESGENLGVELNEQVLEKVFYSTRPYGGAVCLAAEDANKYADFEKLVKRSNLSGANLECVGKYALLTRPYSPAGSADWTHLYGDISNTAYSKDQLVKLPLGILWFGGNSHHDVLPRHSHGPTEQVVGGRLFIEGINMLSARDVYTSRVLWKRNFSDLGTFGVYYDDSYKDDPLDTSYNQKHIPGANAHGTNYVVTKDKMYLVIGADCMVLDPATGKTMATISLPTEAGSDKKPLWGYIGVYEDLLIAGAKLADAKTDLWNSKKIIVMNRCTGKSLWSRKARYSFRHNAIIAGAGKLFCIDALPEHVLKTKERRGLTPEGSPKLLALDVKTGEMIWQKSKGVFGTWLGYSSRHDILLQCGRNSKDMIEGEPSERMTALRGSSGKVIWDKPIDHSGPCMLADDTIYLNAHSTEGSAVNLLTGEKKMRTHPLTGERVPWTYRRFSGCNSALGGRGMLMVRSGAAGFYDLERDGGTGNFGGFKSGCTANLVAANGVLNAPDYTRTCTCSYQNQTSLALIHMPEVEMWTFNRLEMPKEKSSRIKRLGLNFGAPGDRMADDGTLWLDWPDVGGPGPEIKIKVEPAAKVFRHHSSRIRTGDKKWVAASGLKDVAEVEVTLCPDAEDEQLYTVKLYFAELARVIDGERIFDIFIQGRKVLGNFDIVKQAGGNNRAIVKKFEAVKVKDALKIEFKPVSVSKTGPVLCGIEVIARDS